MVKKTRQPADRSFPVPVSHGFLHGPAPLGDRKQFWVHSFLWEKWMWSQIMINSFTPLSPRHILDPFFTRHISSEHSDTEMTFFRHTNQEKNYFVPDLSLSQQHILVRFGKRCFPPCFTMDINGHLTKIKQICDTKSIITLPDEAEGWSKRWLCSRRRQEECLPFHTTGTAYSGGSCVNIDHLCTH